MCFFIRQSSPASPETSPPVASSWRWCWIAAPTPSSKSRSASRAAAPAWRCRRSACGSRRCSWRWCNRCPGPLGSNAGGASVDIFFSKGAATFALIIPTLTVDGSEHHPGVVVGDDIGVAVLWLVHFHVGVLPGELLGRVDGLGRKGRRPKR